MENLEGSTQMTHCWTQNFVYFSEIYSFPVSPMGFTLVSTTNLEVVWKHKNLEKLAATLKNAKTVINKIFFWFSAECFWKPGRWWL